MTLIIILRLQTVQKKKKSQAKSKTFLASQQTPKLRESLQRFKADSSRSLCLLRVGKILTRAFTNTSAFFVCTVYGILVGVHCVCTWRQEADVRCLP